MCAPVVSAFGRFPNPVTELRLAPQAFYEDAADRAGAVSPDDYQFYLSEGGVCVEFAAGELAPYTEGVKTVLIPYEQIALWIVPGKGLSEEDE